MISYIKGSLEYISEGLIIVEAGGIGYSIQIPASAIQKLPAIGSPVAIHTVFDVRDSGVSLFGFITREERGLFTKLITVNGVGPKSALGILSILPPSELILAVVSGSEKELSKAPGIGKKTAQRIIIDLKDKFKLMTAKDFQESFDISAASADTPKAEAVSALCALGYSNSEALKAVSQVYEDGMTTEDILKSALKKLSLF